MPVKRLLVVAALLALIVAPGTVLAQQTVKVIKYAHFQPARPDQPKHAAALAFKAYVEANSGGSLQVQIFPAGQFGNDAVTMEGLRLGNLEMAVAHDGAIAVVWKPIALLAIPYLFEDQAMAWAVLDGPFGQEYNELMLKQTGIRLFGFGDNGIRHFTNSKRPIRTPDDMKGLKIRVMPSPVFQTLVNALGASPSAIPWAELPTALQQKVVDGEENGVTNILAASLYQYQKYVTLDGHVYSVHGYLMNGKFWDGLTKEQQAIVCKGVEIAKWIHRGMTTAEDMNAKGILESKGMEVTTLTPAQIEAFRQRAQGPVRAWVEQQVGKELVGKLFAAIDAYKKAGPYAKCCQR